jgi:hypothetical protein
MRIPKILIALVLVLSSVCFFTAGLKMAYAIPPLFQVGVVAGVVSVPGGNPAIGANIHILCNGNTLDTTTDVSGLYEAHFVGGVCAAGQNVTVTATHGGLTGVKNGIMADSGSAGYVKIDVAIVNIPLVPEFGLITGGMAFLTSGGVLYLLRKRI